MSKYIFLSISLLILFFKSTYAFQEEFFPSGDVTQNRYYDALGYSIGSIPTSEECPNCIQYDKRLIKGSNTREVLSNVKLFDVAQRYNGIGLRRMPNVLDRVALPPNSLIDFVYWGFNDTGTDVYIDSLEVFLSRYYQSQGDISKIVNMEGTNEEVGVLYYNYLRSRVGLVKTYPGLGIVRYSGNPLNPIILDSGYVKSPLAFRNWKYIADTGEMEVTVENISDSALKNVKFEHLGYEEIYSFQPLDTHTFRYMVQWDLKDLSIASVSDPNSQEECVVYSTSLESLVIDDSTPLMGSRSNGSVSKYYFGSRVLDTELGKGFCIKRIPYKLFSGEMKFEEENDEKIENTEGQITHKDFDIPEVKGAKKLPQTSKGNVDLHIYFAVVAGMFLWYYLYRRKKYES